MLNNISPVQYLIRYKDMTVPNKIEYVKQMTAYSDAFPIAICKYIDSLPSKFYAIYNDKFEPIGGFAIDNKNYLAYLYVSPEYRRLHAAENALKIMLEERKTINMYIRADNEPMLNLVNKFNADIEDVVAPRQYDGAVIKKVVIKR